MSHYQNARRLTLCAAFALLLLSTVAAQDGNSSASASGTSSATVEEKWVRADEEMLASDAMRGRGSGTTDEKRAADAIAAELKSFGVQPAGDNGTFIETVTVDQPELSGPPELTYGIGSPATRVQHGKGFDLLRTSGSSIHGPLEKLAAADATPKKGAVVLLTASGDFRQIFASAAKLIQRGAAAVLVETPERLIQRLDATGHQLPRMTARIEGVTSAPEDMATFGVVSPELFKKMSAEADGSPVSITVNTSGKQIGHTYNVLGMLRGSDATLGKQAILLSAHLDHLGVGKADESGDNIYNGADDDASGCTAVLELARALASGPKPKRTVLFAFFGSEEKGGYGAIYFREHPPVPLTDMAANLEFEMIGEADPKVKPDELWLTGWERSNRGPELAKHGAKLVQDPHPTENFFMRSDNYALARRGVVAQTVSSFSTTSPYHAPNDDIGHLDFKHMTEAIQSLIAPVRWLADSDFKPEWNAGGKP